MTLYGVKLFTWVDVEEVLLEAQAEGRWPVGLVSARAYWDSLEVRIKPGAEEEVRHWLAKEYEPRYRRETDEIELVSRKQAASGEPLASRTLSVQFAEESSEELGAAEQAPHFGRPTRLTATSNGSRPDRPLPPSVPPVVAFHSYKGGVGRTTHAIAFALCAVELSGKSVLLIDGDFEAPGITWLVQGHVKVSIGYSDFLSLVHSDPSPGADDAVLLCAEEMASQRFDQVFVLPAFRKIDRWSTVEVPPNLLNRRGSGPFALTELLARLGEQLDVAAVVVDLRAGLSELSAGLMLDPRVFRILVTTVSGQSVEGTGALLQLLGKQAPPRADRDDDPLGALVINSVLEDLVGTETLAGPQEALLRAGSRLLRGKDELDQEATDDDAAKAPLLAISVFDQRLLTLPTQWEEACGKIRDAGLPHHLTDLVRAAVPIASAVRHSAKPGDLSLAERRQRLAEFAAKAEYAERSAESPLLPTRSLRRLSRDFGSKPPVVVITGAKGSGKTFTFLQLARTGTWQSFTRAVTGAGSEDGSGWKVIPTMAPRNLPQETAARLDELASSAAMQIGGQAPTSMMTVRERAADTRGMPAPAGGWRRWWLDVIAWRCGYKPMQAGVADEFVEFLRTQNTTVVAVLDGLEDLFQNAATDDIQQEALRTLLQDVPEWLRQGSQGRLGVVIFIRGDLLRASVKQNAGQLEALYSDYRLAWGYEEALRLALWTAGQAGVLSKLDGTAHSQLSELPSAELIVALEELWGPKLGRPRSRDARTDRWVLAVLSDFNDQIQARDMVRLIQEAAEHSARESGTVYDDRLLTPAALRSALSACGRKKVEELELESPGVAAAFGRMRDSSEERQVPFRAGSFGLTEADLKALRDQGLILADEGKYYMPELVRQGLGFTVTGRGRAGVLALRSKSKGR